MSIIPGYKQSGSVNGFFANRSLFQSTDYRETIQRCNKVLGRHRMRIYGADGHLNSSFNGIVRDRFAIVRLCHSTPVAIEPESDADYYLVQHNPSGIISVLSPGRAARVKMDSGSFNVVVRLPRNRLEDYLQDSIQRTVKQAVIFDPRMDRHSAASRSWAQAVRHVCAQYELFGSESDLSTRLASTFADYLIGLLLQIQPHNYSDCMGNRGAETSPYYVRKARDFIHGNLSAHISIATLARFTGVSARTLQTGFRRYCDLSPMEYIREQRLACVHKALASADGDPKVTEILTNHGIYDFGRFAQLYRQRYGCLPSATLKKRKLS